MGNYWLDKEDGHLLDKVVKLTGAESVEVYSVFVMGMEIGQLDFKLIKKLGQQDMAASVRISPTLLESMVEDDLAKLIAAIANHNFGCIERSMASTERK